MYCRNCGNNLDDLAVVCVKCGVPKGQGFNYCSNCGVTTNVASHFCTNCGANTKPPVPEELRKSRVAAGILGILLGYLGVHNFYLGYTGKAIAQLLLSILSCGILAFASWVWGLVEGIMILTGSINVDANGYPLKD